MSFDIDDPLAGILSDGSDDSFFDDDILGKKKPAKKKITPIAEKKSTLFNLGDDDKTKTTKVDRKDSLFNLDVPAAQKSSDFNFDVETTKTDVKSPALSKRITSKESINLPADSITKSNLDISKSPAKSRTNASSDKLDILSDLEAKKTKPLEKGKSSQSLLDDILGAPSTKGGGGGTGSTIQSTRPSTAKNPDFDLDSIISKSESKQTVASTKTVAPKQSFKADTGKDNSSKKAKASEDWLGIFQKEEDDVQDDDDGMPAWLVGDSKKKKASSKNAGQESIVQKTVSSKTDQENHEPIKATQEEVKEEPRLPQFVAPAKVTMPVSAPMQRVFQGSNEDITAEGAAVYLEQQESQLMLALQLKAQEEKLAAMQMRQKEAQRIQREAAQAQHSQVDAILARQAEQRAQMQAIIAAHQERITNRIKDLLSTTTTEHVDNIDELEHAGNSPNEVKETPHMKEKKQLLQLVQSLQENHDKEIDLMETSYRRQLAFLEISVNQSEERMKDESDKLVKYYTEKITWLEEHHNLFRKLSQENLQALIERHKAEGDMLTQQHLESIRVLQEHHATLMENIKSAVKQEQLLIQDSEGFSSNLLELVSDVKDSKAQFKMLVEKIQAITENTQKDTERTLHVRETQINDMILQLKKERENLETEKIESRDIIKILETRLKQMTTSIEEDTSSLKQKKMEFEFEKATFSKQTEFAKNLLKKQEEEIKMIRDEIQKEYKEKITKIEEERAKALKDSATIAKEKASIQNLKQELEKTKVELQAQLEEVSDERSKLNLEKQHMHMEEQRILAKSRDLDLLAKTAIEKQTQADKKYAEAEFIQKKYEDRIRRMQEHVVSLNTREKQIAKEKVALSRERLSLHNERKQIESRHQCSLCRSTQAVPYKLEPNYASTLPDAFVDTHASNRDYASGNVNYALSAIEQEMAQLLGKSFSLKHSFVGIDGHENKPEESYNLSQTAQMDAKGYKDYMDPKFMMLRLDVQQVLSNLEQTKENDEEKVDQTDDN